MTHHIRRFWRPRRTLTLAMATLGALLLSVASASAQPRALVPVWGLVSGNAQVTVVDGAGNTLAPYIMNNEVPSVDLRTYATVASPDGTRMYVANDIATGNLQIQMVDLLTG